MAAETYTGVNEPYDLAVNEAENILESYLGQESYSNSFEAPDIDSEVFEKNISEAVDDLDVDQDYEFRKKIMKASGALTSSAGAAIILTGNPLGLAPLAMGGGQYLAGKARGSSKVQEIETKAFLQDEMNRNLNVEENDGEFTVAFDYTESRQ